MDKVAMKNVSLLHTGLVNDEIINYFEVNADVSHWDKTRDDRHQDQERFILRLYVYCPNSKLIWSRETDNKRDVGLEDGKDKAKANLTELVVNIEIRKC